MAAERISIKGLIDTGVYSQGKAVRLYRIFYEHGPGNGTGLFLPIDQGLEHGPVDFFPNPPSVDPDFQCRLALEGNYSAIVFQPGPSRKYMRDYVGRVPLVYKLNGKTNVPSDADAFSPLTGTVEEACELGADGVGYTLYVGSPAQDRDFAQLTAVRRECDRLGMPLIVWSYPRGSAIGTKGGRDSLYAVDYAARVACELGADVVKLNLPKFKKEDLPNQPKPYDGMTLEAKDAMAKVVESAGRVPVLVSGGSKISDEDLLAKAEDCLEAGVVGLIFGRNMWQRPLKEALAMTENIHELMAKYGR